MLDTLGYKHTLTLCNIYLFATATIVARIRLNVTLSYISCPVECHYHRLLSSVAEAI